ncbi:phage tail terminator protein [Marinobacterium litorale]|jgi:hypothetical protein|uniref:phage tail terminator protein n=1 Tax=Marinobacterium litorale TaxID=404770 RepID=UPI0003F85DD5|nr:hypothetical protein [Marinobacterium litorale]
MSQPFDTTLVEQRLRDQVAGIDSVEGAAEYAAVKDLRTIRPGTAYVVLAGEKAKDSPDSVAGDRRRGKRQALCTFGVIICGRNYRGRTGKTALQDISPLIGSVREALEGWVPVKPFQPIAWLQGDVMDYDQERLLWIDVFTTTHYIGGTA